MASKPSFTRRDVALFTLAIAIGVVVSYFATGVGFWLSSDSRAPLLDWLLYGPL